MNSLKIWLGLLPVALLISSCGRIGYSQLSNTSAPDGSVPDSSIPDSSLPDSSVPDGSVDASCTDGQQNGDESGVDCGGSCSECIQQWAQSFGGTDWDLVSVIGVDSANNIYIAGSFENSIDFGGGALVGVDATDIFLASFDSDGAHRWSQMIPLSGANKLVQSLAIDSNDNVILGVTALLASDISSLFNYDSNGSLRWSDSLGGTAGSSVMVFDVSTDANGDVYFVGRFSGSLGTLVAVNLYDILVGKYDGDTGASTWLTGYGSSASETGLGIVAAADGAHFITGTYNGASPFGGPAAVGSDVFIAAFNSAGALQWSRSDGSTGSGSGQTIALGGNNQVFVGGRFDQEIDFGTGTHTSNGDFDGFLVSVAASTGQVQWSTQFGGTNSDVLRDMHVTESGKVLLCGDYVFDFNVDGAPFTSTGGWDAYVVAYDALTGASAGWQNYGGSGGSEDRGHGLASDSDGAMYFTGWYTTSIDVVGEVLTSVGAADIFLVRTTEP